MKNHVICLCLGVDIIFPTLYTALLDMGSVIPSLNPSCTFDSSNDSEEAAKQEIRDLKLEVKALQKSMMSMQRIETTSKVTFETKYDQILKLHTAVEWLTAKYDDMQRQLDKLESQFSIHKEYGSRRSIRQDD